MLLLQTGDKQDQILPILHRMMMMMEYRYIVAFQHHIQHISSGAWHGALPMSRVETFPILRYETHK